MKYKSFIMLITCTAIFLITFVLVCYFIRKIIYISHKKNLFDIPTENRKIHVTKTPNLGGVAIFATMIFIASLFLPLTTVLHLNYISACAFILFFLGLTDDLVGVNPSKKILAQLGVALLMTLPANFRITNFYGFMGWTEMSFAVSLIVSVLFILLVINSFNLIDGINCLAGGVGLLVCACFAYFFWQMKDEGFLFLSIAMCGCLTGFLFFNRTPARIFMGDTGSLFLGFIIAILAIHFIEGSKAMHGRPVFRLYDAAPALVFALLIVPIFDTLRVFIIRILKRKSPFQADRNHIHHLLLDLKYSHLQATGILLLVNIAAIILVFILHELGTGLMILILSLFSLGLNTLLQFKVSRKARGLTNEKKPAEIFETSYHLGFLYEGKQSAVNFTGMAHVKKNEPVLE